MRKIILSLLSVLSISTIACSNNDGQADTQTSPMQESNSGGETTKREIENQETHQDSYSGKQVTLIYPSDTNYGKISIHGEDARHLFEALRVKVNADDENEFYTIKNGRNMSCKYSKLSRDYECSFVLQYRSGFIRITQASSAPNLRVPSVREFYYGADVVLWADDPENMGRIQIKGRDAEALFNALYVPTEKIKNPINNLPSLQKRGEDLICRGFAGLEADEKLAYSCSFYINHATGKIQSRTP